MGRSPDSSAERRLGDMCGLDAGGDCVPRWVRSKKGTLAMIDALCRCSHCGPRRRWKVATDVPVKDGNENADTGMDGLEDTQSDVVQPCHQETDETKSPEQLTRQERFPQAPLVHPQSPAHKAQDDYMEFDVLVRVIDVCTKDLGGGCYVIGIRTAGQGMKRTADSLPGTPRERPADSIGSPVSLKAAQNVQNTPATGVDCRSRSSQSSPSSPPPFPGHGSRRHGTSQASARATDTGTSSGSSSLNGIAKKSSGSSRSTTAA